MVSHELTHFLPDVVEEHADTAGFMVSQRGRLVRSRTAGFADLSRFDDRIDAHLDALVLAAEDEHPISVAVAGLMDAFVRAVVALRRRLPAAFAEEVERGRGQPRRAQAIVAALGWVPAADAFLALEAQGDGMEHSPAAGADSRLALLQAIRLHRSGSQRHRDLVAESMHHDDPLVRRMALRVAGELGLREFAGLVTRARGDADDGCRAWAAWTGALFGDPDATQTLVEFARAGGAADLTLARVLEVLVRVAAPGEVDALLRELFLRGREREVIDAMAAWGDTRMVPWLLDLLHAPSVARLAGWCFVTITGFDAAGAQLVTGAPRGFQSGPSNNPFERDVGMDADARLPWLDPIKTASLWKELERGMPRETRVLLGRPREAGMLDGAIRGGAQRLREIATLDLHVMSRGARALFNVHAPAFRQLRWMHAPGTVGHVAAR